MTHLPDRIIVDAEFVDDDEPTTNTGSADRPDRPGLAARATTFLSAAALREATAVREGLRVLGAERAGWFNSDSTLVTDAHVRADLLNDRYATWQQEVAREAQRLTEKAEELEKSADQRLAEASADDAGPGDHQRLGKDAEKLRSEAAAWRERVRKVELQPYTGHREPTAAELAGHRKRMGNRRRWKAIAAGVAAGWGMLQFGGPTLLGGILSGLVAVGWAKGRFTTWRAAPPEVPQLDYAAPAAPVTASASAAAGPPGAAFIPNQASPARPGFTKPAGAAPGFTASWTPAGTPAPAAPSGPAEGELDCEETDQLTEAMLAAGAISEGTVRLARPDSITRVPGGWLAHIVLPKGDGVTVETVLPKLGQVAGEMGLDRARFFMDPVHASAGGNAKTIAVAAFQEDPFTTPRTSPLVGMDSVDVWTDGIPVAFDAFGALVNLVLKDTSLALGGASRSGKGAALRGIIAGALLDLRVNLRLVDGKAPGQDRWRNLAATFVDEPGTKGAKRTRALLEALVADLDRRAAILKRYGMEQIDDPDLIAELGGLELVVVDEAAAITGDKKHGTAIKEALSSLAARGLAFGIILVIATQVVTKGNDGVLPRLVTGNITWKWAMRVTETTESNMALSQGAAKAGWDASTLDPAIRGMGILLADRYRRIRSLWLDGPDLLALIDTITRLRTAAGRLRGQWNDPIEAAMRGLSTPAPGHTASPRPAPPVDEYDDIDEGQDDEFGPEGEDDGGEHDGLEDDGFTADGVPVLLLRAHEAVVDAGGRMHTGPLAEALGYEDSRKLGIDLNALLREVDVERPAGGQLRVPGADKPGLGYYAETLATAIDRYRE
ncbi:FtsK/SpoIIIE domain-containing protein (plasmid) [Streptomyces sp. NBC_00257]|uniref:FtsK/SpoIIIE domain-containing protein n=1 Tax=unclassified Streptomyces TaxID=2593676 RepID=UPI00225C32CC|nr:MULTISPECIES: FtsK/SpoIIIE domain-containing protein [unclassified Streptomyces]MCX5434788.1 FtsK/SpoIIIE domain-containing protein [Streptomyces sp. NBC_00062]